MITKQSTGLENDSFPSLPTARDRTSSHRRSRYRRWNRPRSYPIPLDSSNSLHRWTRFPTPQLPHLYLVGRHRRSRHHSPHSLSIHHGYLPLSGSQPRPHNFWIQHRIGLFPRSLRLVGAEGGSRRGAAREASARSGVLVHERLEGSGSLGSSSGSY